MSGQGTYTSDWLLGAVKKNPEGLLLLAAGAVLLMRKAGGGGTKHTRRQGGPRSSHNFQSQNDSFTEGLTDGLGKAATGAKDYVGDMAERTGQTVSSVASSAADFADQARRTVSRQSEWAINQAQSTFQTTMDRVLRDQPLVIALAGMAAGAAVAATFRATDFEKETLGPIGEQVSEAAARVGEQLKEATAKAGEKLKNVVDEKGLAPGNLKEVASEVAGAFGNSMTGGTGGSSSGSDNAGQTSSAGGKSGQTSSAGGKTGQANPAGGKTAQTNPNPTGGYRG